MCNHDLASVLEVLTFYGAGAIGFVGNMNCSR